MQPGQIEVDLPGYFQFWNSADKKGYSGTAIFTKTEPVTWQTDFGRDVHRHEGRVITLEYPEYFLLTVYTPNAQAELARIDYRMQWENDFRAYVQSLMDQKPIILCGDLNAARGPIELYDPEQYEGTAGYSEQERACLEELLGTGLTDTFRALYPDRADAYTWWSYMRRSRARNAGWRIDYFLVSDSIAGDVKDSIIYTDVAGSDHCPIGLVIF